ncbi:MAG: histidine phosphatase family protein [Actinomycetota bacterium]
MTAISMDEVRYPNQSIVLVRHAETGWSAAGRHTSFTDVPLSDEGRRRAAAIASFLKGRPFELVLTSPLKRAIETCRIAGFGDVAKIRSELKEWDYGDYEGRTTAEIRKVRPDWILWEDGAPGGESPQQVQSRVDPIVDELLGCHGDVAVFSHGHLLRALAARWINLSVAAGRSLRLETGSISVLGWEREIRVIDQWNRAV